MKSMRKAGALLLVAGMLVALPVQSEAGNRGGVIGFFVGCCFGVRTAAEYNAGKDLHFRDWGRLIPYVGTVFAIWDGIEGAQGTTSLQLKLNYGAQYF